MLNISHLKTTAYHHESNGAVKRLHCRLKDALHAHAATATWSKELPFVLLGLRSQQREDTGLSPAEAVLAFQLCCLMNFYKVRKFLFILLLKIFQKLWMFLPFPCLGTIPAPSCSASCQQSSFQPPSSGSVSIPFLQPLQRPLRRPAPRTPLLHHPS
jgi:hypothetical protein